MAHRRHHHHGYSTTDMIFWDPLWREAGSVKQRTNTGRERATKQNALVGLNSHPTFLEDVESFQLVLVQTFVVKNAAEDGAHPFESGCTSGGRWGEGNEEVERETACKVMCFSFAEQRAP